MVVHWFIGSSVLPNSGYRFTFAMKRFFYTPHVPSYENEDHYIPPQSQGYIVVLMSLCPIISPNWFLDDSSKSLIRLNCNYGIYEILLYFRLVRSLLILGINRQISRSQSTKNVRNFYKKRRFWKKAQKVYIRF